MAQHLEAAWEILSRYGFLALDGLNAWALRNPSLALAGVVSLVLWASVLLLHRFVDEREESRIFSHNKEELLRLSARLHEMEAELQHQREAFAAAQAQTFAQLMQEVRAGTFPLTVLVQTDADREAWAAILRQMNAHVQPARGGGRKLVPSVPSSDYTVYDHLLDVPHDQTILTTTTTDPTPKRGGGKSRTSRGMATKRA